MFIVVLTINGAPSTSKSLKLKMHRVIRYFLRHILTFPLWHLISMKRLTGVIDAGQSYLSGIVDTIAST